MKSGIVLTFEVWCDILNLYKNGYFPKRTERNEQVRKTASNRIL